MTSSFLKRAEELARSRPKTAQRGRPRSVEGSKNIKQRMDKQGIMVNNILRQLQEHKNKIKKRNRNNSAAKKIQRRVQSRAKRKHSAAKKIQSRVQSRAKRKHSAAKKIQTRVRSRIRGKAIKASPKSQVNVPSLFHQNGRVADHFSFTRGRNAEFSQHNINRSKMAQRQALVGGGEGVNSNSECLNRCLHMCKINNKLDLNCVKRIHKELCENQWNLNKLTQLKARNGIISALKSRSATPPRRRRSN